MPNPYRYHTLTASQSEKAHGQLRSIVGYLDRFVWRLRELNVEEADPLLDEAKKAAHAVEQLSTVVLLAVKVRRDGDDLR